MTQQKNTNRAQLILTLDEANLSQGVELCAKVLNLALESSNFAAMILPKYDLPDHRYIELASELVPLIQSFGVAALLDDVSSTQLMGRLDADGLLLQCKGESWVEDCLDLVHRFGGQKSIGVYGNLDRESSLTTGDLGVDMIHFGPLGRDIKPEPHAKNIKLAEWWAQMVEVPCLIPAGNDVNSVVEAAQTQAEFVVISKGVLAAKDVAKAASEAASLIQTHAPELNFED